MGRLLGRLIVGSVLCLISFIAYSSQIFIIWPWYGAVLSVELLTLLLPFNALVAMLFWNYYLCVVTDPGRVPDGWKPDTNSADGYEVKKLTGSPRFCRSCEKYKPPRAHHCRQCNRCVLRMDHHCPWINNCVGHFNYGHFIRFLFYVDLACSYHLVMVTRRVFCVMGGRYWDEPSGTEMVFIIMNYVACVPVLLAVGAFSIYHFFAMMGNTTTIEGWEKDKAATLVRRGKIQEIKFPYNLGRIRNIKSVLGERPWLWCWPTVTPGTGLKFQLPGGNDITAENAWPPEDPTRIHIEEDPNHVFSLPNSPWTYENGSLNPDLQAFNARLRSSTSTSKRRDEWRNATKTGSHSVPPYHPDYNQQSLALSQHYDSSDSEANDDAEIPQIGIRIRRGSEGYEVRPVGREEMLQRYLMEDVQFNDKYQRYVPDAGSDSATEDGNEDLVPLGQLVHKTL